MNKRIRKKRARLDAVRRATEAFRRWLFWVDPAGEVLGTIVGRDRRGRVKVKLRVEVRP